MLNILNTKALILMAVILSVIAGILSYVSYQSQIAAVAATASEQRQRKAEQESKKFWDDVNRKRKTQSADWGNAAQSFQNYHMKSGASAPTSAPK